MKRVISIILVLSLCLSLCFMMTGCSKTGECELCGKEATLHKVEVGGESAWVCESCEEGLDALGGFADMFQ